MMITAEAEIGTVVKVMANRGIVRSTTKLGRKVLFHIKDGRRIGLLGGEISFLKEFLKRLPRVGDKLVFFRREPGRPGKLPAAAPWGFCVSLEQARRCAAADRYRDVNNRHQPAGDSRVGARRIEISASQPVRVEAPVKVLGFLGDDSTSQPSCRSVDGGVDGDAGAPALVEIRASEAGISHPPQEVAGDAEQKELEELVRRAGGLNNVPHPRPKPHRFKRRFQRF